MTHLPHDDRSVRGIHDYAYEIPQQCAHPFCSNTTGLQRHHLWPRSFLRGQPQDWVMAPYGVQVGNVVNLCLEHHQKITENETRITWGVGPRVFYWVDEQGSFPLNPHPPVSPGVPAASGAKSCKYSSDRFTLRCEFPGMTGCQCDRDEAEATESQSKRGETIDMVGTMGWSPDALEAPSESHRAIPEGEQCPTCKRRVPKKKREASKNRVTYSIRVPKDKQENGVEILEEAVAQLEVWLGHSPARPAYYTLVDALGLMLLHGKDILE